MSLERYVQWGYESFKDNKTGEIDYDYIKLLNQQAERIAELEEQLKNSRVKFFLGYDSEFNMVVKELNLNFILPDWMHNKDFRFYDTQKEAQAKLEELRGNDVKN